MYTCCLQPPNSRFLSDAVIGRVVQRARPSDTVFKAKAHLPAKTSTTHPRAGSQDERAEKAELLYDGHSTQFGPRRMEALVKPVAKLQASHVSLKPHGTGLNEHPPSLKMRPGRKRRYEFDVPAGSRLLTERERNRNKQRRYRKKQEDLIHRLEHETRELRDQIQKLDQRRQSLYSSALTKETVWKVAVEYFRVFRYGMRGAATSATRSYTQLAFSEAAMSPDVRHNTGHGIDAFVANWERFCDWFQDIELYLVRLEQDTEDSVVATVTTSFTISDTTLLKVFPNLCSGSNDVADRNKKQQIAKKLLGQRIVMRGLTRFEWDCAFGRVTSVISEEDLVTPMLHLLGSLEDVSLLFENDVARPDFKNRNSSL